MNIMNIRFLTNLFLISRAVTDPRDGRRVALKKLPNVFQSLVSSKRVFRELKMLCFFKHENVSGNSCLISFFYILHLTELSSSETSRFTDDIKI